MAREKLVLVDIVEKHLIHDDHEYAGILYVGDPHATPVLKGTRLEKDGTGVTLGKLEWALAYAEEHNLLVVCLGDLLDDNKLSRNSDANVVFLARILALFRRYKGMICLVGNHDKGEEHTFNEHDVMSIIAATGFVNLINDAGFIGHFNINGKTIALGASPYGYLIPTEVQSEHEVVWITHHELNFDPRFHKIKCFEIKGCNTVVNGHIHLTFPPIKMGDTWWWNPGNLLRVDRYYKDHTPSVWRWDPVMDIRMLERIEVPHNKKVFADLEDSEPMIEDTLTTKQMEEATSVFIESLKSDVNAEKMKTSDGSLVRDMIDEAKVKLKLSNEVEAVINHLLEDVVQEDV